ncbi:hypothetical protein [Endozoicomonas sp. Mp262]|uniref:hypothetical protein n=1 Tax=Endozoicomonas sp. Mp262 TaxID=2919499 RepID=UPI0021D9850C
MKSFHLRKHLAIALLFSNLFLICTKVFAGPVLGIVGASYSGGVKETTFESVIKDEDQGVSHGILHDISASLKEGSFQRFSPGTPQELLRLINNPMESFKNQIEKAKEAGVKHIIAVDMTFWTFAGCVESQEGVEKTVETQTEKLRPLYEPMLSSLTLSDPGKENIKKIIPDMITFSVKHPHSLNREQAKGRLTKLFELFNQYPEQQFYIMTIPGQHLPACQEQEIRLFPWVQTIHGLDTLIDTKVSYEDKIIDLFNVLILNKAKKHNNVHVTDINNMITVDSSNESMLTLPTVSEAPQIVNFAHLLWDDFHLNPDGYTALAAGILGDPDNEQSLVNLVVNDTSQYRTLVTDAMTRLLSGTAKTKREASLEAPVESNPLMALSAMTDRAGSSQTKHPSLAMPEPLPSLSLSSLPSLGPTEMMSLIKGIPQPLPPTTKRELEDTNKPDKKNKKPRSN